jgi:ribosome biogenesis GTPase A
MSIQWFPGHMFKAKKALEERLADIDVVIEMVDARLPMSSSNPMFASMIGLRQRPSLKILNKQDLADPIQTAAWLDWFSQQKNTRAIALDSGDGAPKQKILAACRALAPHRDGGAKPLRLVICGIPNVGKSTLINALMGRKIAKTGNEPAITKTQQRIQLAEDVVLYDTPGMLWPKIEHETCGDYLAASGAVGRNALDEETIALALIATLKRRYPNALTSRYGLPDGVEATPDDAVLEAIGRRRGAVRSGGVVDYQKAAEILFTDFRAAIIARVTLETPEEWGVIAAEIARRQAIERAEEAERRALRKGSKGRGKGKNDASPAQLGRDDDEDDLN